MNRNDAYEPPSQMNLAVVANNLPEEHSAAIGMTRPFAVYPSFAEK